MLKGSGSLALEGRPFMGTRKSQGDVYVGLYAKLLSDLSRQHPRLSKTLRRDAETIKSRYDDEGLSFLTVQLPKLGKAVDSSLESMRFECPVEFKRSKENRAIPAFLQGLLNLMYDGDGRLLVGPSGSSWLSEPGGPDQQVPNVLAHVRQICYLLYKLEVPHSQAQEDEVIRSFVATDVGLPSALDETRMDEFLVNSRLIVADVLRDFDPQDVVPRHGPGAVATGERMERKWTFSRLYSAIDSCYPFQDYFMVGGFTEVLDRYEWHSGLTHLTVGEAKVVLVPKDSRGPRLISCEPLEYQWIQQGLGRKLMEHLEAHRATRGFVNFSSQEVNRELAFCSSQTRAYATLDLKDASDRVSCRLVELLFPEEISRYLLACRTHSTRLPNGQSIPLNKYAPMGSALCFPVEAFCFWAIAVGAIQSRYGGLYCAALPDVYVFGDDIIVPSEYMDVVVGALEACGLMVNRGKSFRNGWFRESCGMDAYQGVDVTPTRIHTLWSGSAGDGSAFVSWSAYANALSQKGYTETAKYMFELVEDVYGRIPFGTLTSGFPCRVVDDWFKALLLNLEHCPNRVRLDPHTQSIEISCRFTAPRYDDSVLDDWPRLLRNLVTGGAVSADRRLWQQLPVAAGGDPSKVVRPRSTQIKRGWRRL